MKIRPLVIEVVTLQTPRGRILFYAIATAGVFLARFQWLENLSLWKRFGLDWAPSIGLTRAYWKLIHLDPIGAWHQNKLIYLVLIIWWAILLKDALPWIRQRVNVIRNSN